MAVLGICLLAACSKTPAISDSLPTQEILQTLTSTTTPFVIRSTPISTLTRISTAVPSQTLTPSPTLTEEKALNAFRQLSQGREGCELPCFWGIVPGESTWQEVSKEILPFGSYTSPMERGEVVIYPFSLSNVPKDISESRKISVVFFVRNGKIEGIASNTRWIKESYDFSLAGLLRNAGKPDEVWIWAVETPIDGMAQDELVLFYSKKGLLFYINSDAQLDNNTVIICPQKPPLRPDFSMSSFEILIWSPEIGVPFMQFRTSIFGGYAPDPVHFLRLETLQSGMDTSKFYQTYLNAKTEVCINFPLDKFH